MPDAAELSASIRRMDRDAATLEALIAKTKERRSALPWHAVLRRWDAGGRIEEYEFELRCTRAALSQVRAERDRAISGS